MAGGSGRGGATGSAGTTGTGGAFGAPSCTGLLTAAGEEPNKGVACMPFDPQVCYRTCGPEKTGFKSEFCTTAATYAEMTGCTFDPAKDFSCYRIPSTGNAVCPASVTPQASTDCSAYGVPTCTACNSTQGLPGGGILDATGAAKSGYCVCQAPNAAGLRTWSCAVDASWPCPLGMGCGAGTPGTGGTFGGGGTVGGGGTGGSGRGGATGSGGTTGTGGALGAPSCTGLLTAAGMEPAKGISCGPVDPQLCYRTCGPEKTGFKSETCTTAGAYQEMSGCSFDPTKDYSCYRIPSTGNAACPAGVTPHASADCSAYGVPTCTACNSTQGTPGGGFLDSTGAAKTGYCVCQAPNVAGSRIWSCASDTQWPCPLGAGC
jgi:hypothetical protein